MKKAISKIKTEAEFWEFADCWYQRTKRLAAYRNDESNPTGKRIQAGMLWKEMAARTFTLFEIAKQISLRIPDKLKKRYE